ncbi:response regulator [sulfur-oxidizing endosymbiont of Gigantopelta aegis]|uniref:response regulator n=1 Tax=sulfur-oxidizing endosymbiont of Gigantopelta aegis TaxID=2794934 RepID=UPI0018DC0082|nr:response regulator [sulfur-oxidizing endosymbiont of Gigantopelta aegis]
MSEAKHVLIVDDSLVSRMMIKKGLQALCPQWQLSEAKNADEALEQTKEHIFDLFSIDFNMPGMDGLELMAELNQNFPEAPKALLTANIQDSIQEKTTALNGRCINKPITEKSIEQLVAYFNEAP